MLAATVESTAQLLARGRVVVLAGPGLLRAAGLEPPEARGGLWDRFDPRLCATAEALERTPHTAWSAFAAWLETTRQAAGQPGGPSPAHAALATLEALNLLRGVIVTTTDGLLRASGLQRTAELFGAIDRLRCRACHEPHAGLDAYDPAAPPRCDRCGGALRPDMVLFGENMPRRPRELAAGWVYGGAALLILGADITRPPLRRIPVEMRQEGGRIVAIGEVDAAALQEVRGAHVEGALNEALPAVVAQLQLG